MTDETAEQVLRAVMDLAVKVRDEGPKAVDKAAYKVFIAAGGDCTAALIIAAALIDTEARVDAWWQRPLYVGSAA
jgi:predicted hydrolase (HD superfamily)